MSIIDFIAVVSFGLTCFGLGYTFGKNNNSPTEPATGSFFRIHGNKNSRPMSGKLGDYF